MQLTKFSEYTVTSCLKVGFVYSLVTKGSELSWC